MITFLALCLAGAVGFVVGYHYGSADGYAYGRYMAEKWFREKR